MKRRSSIRTLSAACLALVSLGGCSIKSETAPSRFYLLRALPSDASLPASQSGEGGTVLALGPVNLPAYLDRPQIVTRTPGAEVKLSEFDRWAEPLGDNLAAVLADNLSGLVPTERLHTYPGRLPPDVAMRLTVDVIRFDGSPAGEVVLDARWSILDPDDALLRTERSRLTQPVSGAGYEPLVDAMSRALGVLSREIAQEIRTVARGL